MDERKDENYIPLGINAGGIITNFTAMKNCCILHGHVCEMEAWPASKGEALPLCHGTFLFALP